MLELTGNIGSFYRKKGGSIGNHVLRTVGLVTRGCCDCFPSARNLDADCIKQVLVGKDRKVVEKDALLTAFGLTRFRKKMRGNSAVRKWAAAACNNMQQQTHLQVKGPMSLPRANLHYTTEIAMLLYGIERTLRKPKMRRRVISATWSTGLRWKR